MHQLDGEVTGREKQRTPMKRTPAHIRELLAKFDAARSKANSDTKWCEELVAHLIRSSVGDHKYFDKRIVNRSERWRKLQKEAAISRARINELQKDLDLVQGHKSRTTPMESTRVDE